MGSTSPIVLLEIAIALAGCDRVGPHEGYGVLDTSVYAEEGKVRSPSRTCWVEVPSRPRGWR